MNAICAEVTDNGIERALKRVPDNMDATYKRILNIINAKPRAQRELARRILIWTAYARRPLPIDALAYAISIETDTKPPEDTKSSVLTEESIIDACANLVSVENRHVQFIHFSVQEFLTGHHSNTLSMGSEVAHREIAHMCMIFLTLFPKQSDTYTARWLYQYAFDEWPHHLLAGDLNSLLVDDQIVALTLQFFEKSPVLLTNQPKRLQSFFSWEKEKIYLKFSPPVLALIFNLPGMQQYWPPGGKQLEQGPSKAVYDYSLNCIVLSNDKLAIHYATAELDSGPVVRRLYSHGYSLNYSYSDPDGEDSRVQDWLRVSSLYSVQSTEIARYLLNNGISIEPHGLHNRVVDPFKYFAQKGNRGVEIFQLLLNRVVDPGDGRLKDALRAALQVDCLEAVRLLLDKGVDINNFSIPVCGTVLQAAVYGSQVEVIRLLLDYGADVNAQGGQYGNALRAAVFMGKVDVIQLLLDMGADVNTQGGEYGNALQAAVWKGKIEVVRLLLDKGANINAQGGMYGNALRAAVYNGNIQVVRLLLDKGANINAQGGTYGSALQAAAWRGKVDVIQLLLDMGADVNTQGGMYGTALQAAAYGGKIGALRLLLSKGASINAQGGMYGNALEAAAYGSNIQVTQLLLAEGANINAQGGVYGNALQAAAYGGKIGVVQLLLDQGADINAQGGMFGTVLQAAAFNGNMKVIQLLLDRGADINARGGKYGAALEKILALKPVAGQKVPTDIPLLVELLQDHAPFLMEQMPESGYKFIARKFLNEDRCSLDVFRES